MTLELESSLRAPLNRKSTFKTRKWCSTCEGYGHHAYGCTSIKCSTCEGYGDHAYKCPSIKCYKCGEFGHYDYQCPSNCQHNDIVHTDEINNSRIVKDVHIPLEVNSDVDKLVKSNTTTLDKTHVHEENISDVQDALVECSTPIPDDIDVSKDDISEFEHVLVESSMPVQVARYSLET